MEKLDMQTPNIADKNFEILSKMFPNAITETINENGEVVRAVDADVLRQEISCTVVEGKDERYQFTWPDKKRTIVMANEPINSTLRPCRDESIEFESTENLYIEGDNLDVLKLLQETYLGKIKMIYIDPPYNTGNDFIYEDDYSINTDEYYGESGQFDEEGNRLVKNLESNGRFHTDWLNMFYSRIKVCKGLLADNGAIFISIDDHEQTNAKKICDEIFGEKNFVACVVWQRTYAPISLKKYFSESHEYCLVYAKNLDEFKMNLLPRSEKQNKDYKNPDNDPRGPWKVGNLTVGPAVEKQVYTIVGPTGKEFNPPSGYCWRFTKEKFEQMRADNRIWFGADGSNSPVPKLFLTEVQDGVTPMTLWTFEDAGHGQEATRELRDLMGAAVFTSPKPVRYLERFFRIGLNKDDIILDFFSGSATTAHTIMKLNAEDSGSRKYILVQIPEKVDEKSEAYKKGYRTICDIGKERIKRSAEKVANENECATFDKGFRVLKLDSSNMKDVYYNPAATQQTLMDFLSDNIKEDRTPEDLLFQVMLDLGVLLSSKIEETEIAGKKVFSVADDFLIACFDTNVTEETVKAIAAKKPYYAVFRDSSMASDSVATNFDQIFATISPETVRKVL
ncbi:MAG: site-specific DNA-methyltransferase [Lachnospiraceae bacterium]|nr:site-specific DNA-methyltransferase [Lachnospiraceae bacterium]